MSVEDKALLGIQNDRILKYERDITELKTDNAKLKSKNSEMEKNISSLSQKNTDNLKKLDKLSKKNAKLKSQVEVFQDEAITSKAKSIAVPSRIGNIILGFIIGFGFTFLIIFIMWFTSLFTESISDVYKEIFCSNKLK